MSAVEPVLQPCRDYRICGLWVRSEVALPGSIEWHGATHVPDVQVRLGKVPDALAGAVAGGPNWQLAPPRFLLQIPGTLRMLVESGSHILVEPLAGVDVRDAAVFIVGSGLAVVQCQRGALMLHASAVACGTRSYAFAGVSGAGKSTLAALLCLRGACKLVSDDVTTIDVAGDAPLLHSDARQLRLWDDAIELLVLQSQRRGQVRSMLHKYHVGPGATCLEAAPPLAAIYLLEVLPAPGAPSIEPLTLVEAAPALQEHIYRRAFGAHIAPRADFARIARLLSRVQAFRLRRRLDADAHDQVVAALQAHWDTLQ